MAAVYPHAALNAEEPMAPLPRRLTRVRRDLRDTYTLTMDAPRGYRFLPGQFNMLYAFGVGEVPISISGDAADPGTLVHTVRAVGRVSEALCRMKAGHMVGLRGPFGSAWPVDTARGMDALVIAGGIGMAPLRPVMYHLLANRADYGRVVLLYGARSPREMLFRRQLEQWRGRFDCYVDATVDRGDEDWHGKVGVVTKLIGRARFDPEHTVAFVCGPEIMMGFTLIELDKAGVPQDQVYISMERNMKCALGFCGHCQYGPGFVCKDGPVYRFDRIAQLFHLREV